MTSHEWGRVAEDGTVFVRTQDGERSVGQYPEGTPEEALRGMTVNAARARDLRDRGMLAAGRRADFVAWNVEHPNELAYWFGHNLCARVIAGGKERGDVE